MAAGSNRGQRWFLGLSLALSIFYFQSCSTSILTINHSCNLSLCSLQQNSTTKHLPNILPNITCLSLPFLLRVSSVLQTCLPAQNPSIGIPSSLMSFQGLPSATLSRYIKIRENVKPHTRDPALWRNSKPMTCFSGLKISLNVCSHLQHYD